MRIRCKLGFHHWGEPKETMKTESKPGCLSIGFETEQICLDYGHTRRSAGVEF